MTDLLAALNWRASAGRAIWLLTVMAVSTLLILVSGIALAQLLGLPMTVLQCGIWILWLTWLGVVFPRNRRRDESVPCAYPYRRAFRREILLGVAVAFSQLLRPALSGLIADGREFPPAPSLAIGLPLLLAGLCIVTLGVSALGVARTLFVHEYTAADRAVTIVGIFRILRHPLFLGGAMASLGLAVCTGVAEAIELAVINACVIPLYVHLEDRRCCATLGPAYAEYRKAVGGAIPRRRSAARGSASAHHAGEGLLPTAPHTLVKT